MRQLTAEAKTSLFAPSALPVPWFFERCSISCFALDLPMPRRARTSPRRAPRQKRAEDTVSVLLRATEITLARYGFHAATTNRIAAAAGVSIGTLYHYFPTKEALVETVVHNM